MRIQCTQCAQHTVFTVLYGGPYEFPDGLCTHWGVDVARGVVGPPSPSCVHKHELAEVCVRTSTLSHTHTHTHTSNLHACVSMHTHMYGRQPEPLTCAPLLLSPPSQDCGCQAEQPAGEMVPEVVPSYLFMLFYNTIHISVYIFIPSCARGTCRASNPLFLIIYFYYLFIFTVLCIPSCALGTRRAGERAGLSCGFCSRPG